MSKAGHPEQPSEEGSRQRTPPEPKNSASARREVKPLFFGPRQDKAGPVYNPFPELFLRTAIHNPYLALALSLRHMGFYNFHPQAMRQLRASLPGTLLEEDGSNIGQRPGDRGRNRSRYDPGSARLPFDHHAGSVELRSGPLRRIRNGAFPSCNLLLRHPHWKPDAASMSDGTLRSWATWWRPFRHRRKGTPL